MRPRRLGLAIVVLIVAGGIAAVVVSRDDRAPGTALVIPWRADLVRTDAQIRSMYPAAIPGNADSAVPMSARPQSHLRASILHAPESVRAGDDLRFTVRLSNPTTTPISLAPCPFYRLVIGDGGYTTEYEALLDCARSGPIPASGNVDFAMQIPVDQSQVNDGCPKQCGPTWQLWGPTVTYPAAAARVALVPN